MGESFVPLHAGSDARGRGHLRKTRQTHYSRAEWVKESLRRPGALGLVAGRFLRVAIPLPFSGGRQWLRAACIEAITQLNGALHPDWNAAPDDPKPSGLGVLWDRDPDCLPAENRAGFLKALRGVQYHRDATFAGQRKSREKRTRWSVTLFLLLI